MKKIFTVLVLALAVSLSFTGCASKKAKEKGPKTYRIDIGSVVGSSLNVGEVNELNVSSFFQADKLPVAGDTIRVMWSMVADSDIDNLYVSLAGDPVDYTLGSDISADQINFYAVNIPVEEDMTGPVYISVWSDSQAICATSYVDAK